MFDDHPEDKPAPPVRQLLSEGVGFDEAKIDEAVLAVLYTSAFEENGVVRAWKGINWDSTLRLFKLGYMRYPCTPSKSVLFTDEGAEEARKAAHRLFGGDPGAATTGDEGVYSIAPAAGSAPAEALETTFY